MGGEVMGVYFYVPLNRRPASDDELFRELGCDLAKSSFGPFIMTGREIVTLSDHACAQLYFLKRSLINTLADAPDQEPPLERDPALPFALAIRDGAVQTGAEAAIFSIHSDVLEKLLDNYWMVLARDATSLALERYGLTYMDDDMVKGWELVLGDRDELPGGPSRTLFGSRAGNRWF